MEFSFMVEDGGINMASDPSAKKLLCPLSKNHGQNFIAIPSIFNAILNKKSHENFFMISKNNFHENFCAHPRPG